MTADVGISPSPPMSIARSDCHKSGGRLRRRLLIAAVSAVCFVTGVANVGRASELQNALWQVVSGFCVRGQQATGNPFPCQSVDLEKGFAILGVGGAHFLLIPTIQIEGIESPNLLAPGAPNYWEYAWEARTRLDQAAGGRLSRDQVGLAVNSAQARTQGQLHIHIGCVRPEARAALQASVTQVGDTWSRLPIRIAGHRYRIMRMAGDGLGAANPFKLLADGIPAARTDMASQTLVVVGAKFRDGKNGFYLLADHSRNGFAASGENLLEYKCGTSR
jgi:CDP-diacylglycerol pyrophosphatase